MTLDNIQTRRQYRSVYWNWPVSIIGEHLKAVDIKVESMSADDMLEARQLMDEKIELWK